MIRNKMPHSFEKKHSNLSGESMEQIKKERINGRFNGESMGNALALVKQGISLREAAKLTNLAYATVRRYWLKKQQQLKCNNDAQQQKKLPINKIQRKQIKLKYDWNKMFTAEQELQLAEMCKGATVQQCRKLIYQMAIENNVRMNPKWHIEQLAGRDWLANFQIRQRSILLEDPYSHANNIDDNTKEDKTNEIYHHQLPIKTELIELNHNHESQTNIWNNNFSNNTENINIVTIQSEIGVKDKISSSILPSLTPLELLNNNNQNENSAGCSTQSNTINNEDNLKTDDNYDVSKKFQNGLLNVLNHIANLAAKEKDKDSDELFLMSLLPSLRKVKEEDKLKAKIELIKVLDHF